MVWPVNMRYTKQFGNDEVTLTVTDSGAMDSKGERQERVLLRRLYKNADNAFAALTNPTNQLSSAMWDCYGTGAGYEISDISITIGNVQFGCVEEYDDENGNIVLNEWLETGDTLEDFKQAFMFKETDVLAVRTYNEHLFSKEEITAEANKQMGDVWLQDSDDLFSEFSAYIDCNENALTKTVPEIVFALKDCGALDKAYGLL